jgi:hypothetical protein
MKKTIQLSISEINQLLGLLRVNEIGGFYFGDKKKYWSTNESIKSALIGGVDEKDMQLKRKKLKFNNKK